MQKLQRFGKRCNPTPPPTQTMKLKTTPQGNLPGDFVRTHDVICCGPFDHRIMAVEPSGSPLISSAFLYNYPSKPELDCAESNGNSPHLSRKSLNELESSEKSGIPLNTPWTLWHDK